MPFGPGNEIGRDGDVAVRALEGLLHHFKSGAHEGGTVAVLDLPAQQLREELRVFHGLFGGSAVHAHMAQLQAQHLVHRGTGQLGNPAPVLGFDRILRHHPAAAAAQDLREGQIVQHIVLIHAAGGHELHVPVGSRHALDQLDAADGFRREHLHGLQAEAESDLDVRGIAGSGAYGDALVHAVLHHRGIQTGAYNGSRAGVDRAVHLIRRQYRTGAEQHIGKLLMHPADGFLGRGSPEGNLRHGQAAFRQRSAQRNRVLRVINRNYGNKARQRKFVQKIHDRCTPFPVW